MGKQRWTAMPLAALLNVMLLAALSACGGGNASNVTDHGTGQSSLRSHVHDSSEGTGKEISGRRNERQLALVTDVGGVHDNAFNQSAWEGLQKLAKDTDMRVDYLQSQQKADYVPHLTQFVKGGRDLTWAIGSSMREAVKQVAYQHPEAKLGIIDAEVEAANVKSVVFKEQEGGFLAGVVAGMMTKTNTVGFVGGAAEPAVSRFEAGFRAGMEAVNADAKLLVHYTDAFDAPDLGKKAAAMIYKKGADIIFHAAGATGDGVFGQAKQLREAGRNVWVIGVDKDQAKTFGNDITLTSVMKRVDVAIYSLSKELQQDSFKGEVIALGLKEKAFGLPQNNPNVPREVLRTVAQFSKRIANGEVTVPESL